MDKFTGLLTKIRLLKDKPLVVRFTLKSDDKSINCITAKEILGQRILMLPDDKYTAEVVGLFNVKEQLVVRQLIVLNPDNLIKMIDLW